MAVSENLKKNYLSKKVCQVLLATLVFNLSQVWAYDIKKRYKIIEDKFKTEDMLRPLGHDFLLDISAALNTNLMDVIDEAGKVSKTEGGTTAKVNAANAFLSKYDRTEQNARVGVNIGVPIFSFKVAGVKIVPDLRAHASLGALIGIRTKEFGIQNLVDLVDLSQTGVTPEIQEAVKKLPEIPDGETKDERDIAIALYNNGLITETQKEALKGKFIVPQGVKTAQRLPSLAAMTKLDVKGGLLVNFFRRRVFGYWNTYYLSRTDVALTLSSEDLAQKKNPLDAADEKNTAGFLMGDFKIGYRYKNWRAFFLIEEIKLAQLSEKKKGDSVIPLHYKTPPLLRLHAEARFSLMNFRIKPFGGIHKRDGYELSKGYYFGADGGIYFWGKRIGAQLRLMFDPEHVTISPRLKLWIAQIEYSLKKPYKEEIDDTKVSTIHSINFRIFI